MPHEPQVVGLGPGVSAYLQPPGGWFRNNAGWIAGRDRTLLVDTCATETRARRLLDQLPDQPLTAVITHAHGDHANGAGLVARAGGTVLASAPAAAEIAAGPHTLPMLFEFAGWGDITPPEHIEPVTDDRRIDLGDQVVDVLRVPGRAHTDGDLVVWAADTGVLFAGDLLFCGVTPLAASGSVTGWLAALDWLTELDVRQVVPGHGPLTDFAEAKAAVAGYLDWLLTMVSDVDDPDWGALTAQARDRWPDWLDVERHAVNLRVAHADTHGRQLELPAVAAALLAEAGGPIPLDI